LGAATGSHEGVAAVEEEDEKIRKGSRGEERTVKGNRGEQMGEHKKHIKSALVRARHGREREKERKRERKRESESERNEKPSAGTYSKGNSCDGRFMCIDTTTIVYLVQNPY
jgi:hypothetical protein